MEITNIINQIGNTPLIKLKQVSELTGCNIYGKAEYFNPGESVKDRAALYIVKDAFEKKKIEKGGIIVEGTAGNTGIGLAVVCKAYGLKLKIVIPKTQSEEKKDGAHRKPPLDLPFSDFGYSQTAHAHHLFRLFFFSFLSLPVLSFEFCCCLHQEWLASPRSLLTTNGDCHVSCRFS